MNSALYGNRWTGGDGWYDDDHDTITTNDRGSHDDGCGGGGFVCNDGTYNNTAAD